MNTLYLTIVIIWFLLGAHSAYYFVKQYTKMFNFTETEAPLLVFCVLFPIISHISTYVVYRGNFGFPKFINPPPPPEQTYEQKRYIEQIEDGVNNLLSGHDVTIWDSGRGYEQVLTIKNRFIDLKINELAKHIEISHQGSKIRISWRPK
jgi:hypothetical protein